MIELRSLLIALLVPTLLWAQPSQPSNTDQPEPKATESPQPKAKAEPDLRGTPQMPLAVEIVPTAADKEKERLEWLREHSKEHEEHELVAATWDLVKWTGILAGFTALLFFATAYTAIRAEKQATKALEASTAATQTLIKVERPYVTGGGYSPPPDHPDTPRTFHLEVQNLGKTPAFLTDYDVRFAYLLDVKKEASARKVEPRYAYDDRLAPGEKKEIAEFTVDPLGANVVYGAFWYLDWDKKERCFRFVLRIGRREDTRPDISRQVHPDYSKWD
jgi:hypothetical protein